VAGKSKDSHDSRVVAVLVGGESKPTNKGVGSNFSMSVFWPLAANQNELMPMAAVGRQQLKAHPWMQVPVLFRKQS
jgi:hypothetical protein